MFSLFIMSCSSSKPKSSAYARAKQAQTTPQTVNKQQPVNLTPVQRPDLDGIGPVNIAASNFYFDGTLILNNGNLSLNNCQTGTVIPFAKNKGIYNDLFSIYQSNYNKNTFVRIRGFIPAQTQGSDLMIFPTHLVGHVESECNSSADITGIWVSDSLGNRADGISIQFNKDFTFVFKTKLPENNKVISGEWLFTSPTSIFLSYLEVTDILNHNATFNIASDKIFIPTDKGKIGRAHV